MPKLNLENFHYRRLWRMALSLWLAYLVLSIWPYSNEFFGAGQINTFAFGRLSFIRDSLGFTQLDPVVFAQIIMIIYLFAAMTLFFDFFKRISCFILFSTLWLLHLLSMRWESAEVPMILLLLQIESVISDPTHSKNHDQISKDPTKSLALAQEIVWIAVLLSFSSTGIFKVFNVDGTWVGGTAVKNILSSLYGRPWVRSELVNQLYSIPAVYMAMNYFTLLTELSAPLFIFWKRRRPIWLVAAIFFNILSGFHMYITPISIGFLFCHLYLAQPYLSHWPQKLFTKLSNSRYNLGIIFGP